MMVDDKQRKGTLKFLKKEAATIISSVLATLIGTAVLSQQSNIKALLGKSIQLDTTFSVLLIGFFFVALIAILSGVISASKARKLAAARQDVATAQIRSTLQEEIRVLKTKHEQEMRNLNAVLESFKAEAVRDSLTGVFNSNQVNDLLKARIAEAKAQIKPESQVFCVLLVDIDDFKKINDAYTHEPANRVLKEVAERLTPRGDVEKIARYGGDEFLIISQLGTNAANGFLFADRLRNRVQANEIYLGDNRTEKVTVSCGVAIFRSGDDESKLRERASVALHNAKQPRKDKDGLTRVKNHVYVLE